MCWTDMIDDDCGILSPFNLNFCCIGLIETGAKEHRPKHIDKDVHTLRHSMFLL